MSFKRFKEFIVENESVKSSRKHIFYPLKKSDISSACESFSRSIPDEILTFYAEIGYGFFNTDDRTFANRFIDIQGAVEINSKSGDYEYDPDLDIYDNEEEFIFFELGSGSYLTLNFSDGKVYYFSDVIGNSLEEVLNRIDEEGNYFINQE